MGNQPHAPDALPPGVARYPLYRRLSEPQGRSGKMRKVSLPPVFDPGTVKSVASLYTDWAILSHRYWVIQEVNNFIILTQFTLRTISVKDGTFNSLKTKRRLLYLKTQFVPRSKHFISVIKTDQFML